MSLVLAKVFYVFCAIGLLDTLYLSYHSINKSDVACWFFPKEWCRKVQYSKYSKLMFGIPNAYLGLAMYLAIILLTFYTLGGAAAPWLVKAVVVFGFAFSMFFTYIQAFVLRAFCTWCVISALNFTVMFLCLFLVK